MNQIVAAYPDKELHVVLDNLSTHKPKNDRWLKRHPKVHFHFTPTRASWLNQVEIWFSILSLAGAPRLSRPLGADYGPICAALPFERRNRTKQGA